MRCEDCPMRYYRCDDRCPEAPSRKVKHICAGCGENIYEGERAFQFRQTTFCEECAMNMTFQDLADWFNEPGWVDVTEED